MGNTGTFRVATSWAGASTASMTSFTASLPSSGIVAGDTLFLIISVRATSSNFATPGSITVPSGWGQQANLTGNSAASPGNVRAVVLTKVAVTGDNGATVAITTSGFSQVTSYGYIAAAYSSTLPIPRSITTTYVPHTAPVTAWTYPVNGNAQSTDTVLYVGAGYDTTGDANLGPVHSANTGSGLTLHTQATSNTTVADLGLVLYEATGAATTRATTLTRAAYGHQVQIVLAGARRGNIDATAAVAAHQGYKGPRSPWVVTTATTRSASAVTLDLTVPATAMYGDILFADVLVSTGISGTPPTVIATNPGWTVIRAATEIQTSGYYRAVLRKYATTTDPSSAVTFSHNLAAAPMQAHLTVVRNASQVDSADTNDVAAAATEITFGGGKPALPNARRLTLASGRTQANSVLAVQDGLLYPAQPNYELVTIEAQSGTAFPSPNQHAATLTWPADSSRAAYLYYNSALVQEGLTTFTLRAAALRFGTITATGAAAATRGTIFDPDARHGSATITADGTITAMTGRVGPQRPRLRSTASAFHPSATSLSLTVPATVQAGDVMLLEAAVGMPSTTADVSTPDGWVAVTVAAAIGTLAARYLYLRVAEVGDAGSTITVTSNAGPAALTLLLAAYSGAQPAYVGTAQVNTNPAATTFPVATAGTAVQDATRVVFGTAVSAGSALVPSTAPPAPDYSYAPVQGSRIVVADPNMASFVTDFTAFTTMPGRISLSNPGQSSATFIDLLSAEAPVEPPTPGVGGSATLTAVAGLVGEGFTSRVAHGALSGVAALTGRGWGFHPDDADARYGTATLSATAALLAAGMKDPSRYVHEVLYSTAWYTEKGATIAAGQGYMLAGTVVAQDPEDRKCYRFEGTRTGRDHIFGILRRDTDTTEDDQLTNVVISGTVKLSELTGDDIAALVANGAIVSQARGAVRF